MRGKEMVRSDLRKVDRLIYFLTVFVLISGGLMIHVLTALTINSYYSSPWGFVSFLLPGFAEIYLLAFQLDANIYYYKIILAGFSVMAGVLVLTWLLRNIVRTKTEKPSIHSSTNRLL